MSEFLFFAYFEMVFTLHYRNCNVHQSRFTNFWSTKIFLFACLLDSHEIVKCENDKTNLFLLIDPIKLLQLLSSYFGSYYEFNAHGLYRNYVKRIDLRQYSVSGLVNREKQISMYCNIDFKTAYVFHFKIGIFASPQFVILCIRLQPFASTTRCSSALLWGKVKIEIVGLHFLIYQKW